MPTDEDPARPTALWNDAWRGVLFASARVLQAAEPELIKQAGFPLTWLDVLAQLYDAPADGLRMQDLEQRSLFTRSGLTRLVDRIEAAGLVRREPVPGDRRGVRIVLTPEGRRRHDDAFEHHLQVIEREFAARLTPDQQRAVAESLAGFWHDGDGSPPDAPILAASTSQDS
jgi:DNA-binding MarR family transcriptional regulator